MYCSAYLSIQVFHMFVQTAFNLIICFMYGGDQVEMKMCSRLVLAG